MSTETVLRMIQDAQDMTEFREAALVVQEFIKEPREDVDTSCLVPALAYHGHRLIFEYPSGFRAISWSVLATLKTEPIRATMDESDQRA